MEKEIIFIILPQYADWEYAFVASSLNQLEENGKKKYVIKTASIIHSPIISMGGFKSLPDYDITEIPNQYEALILVGGLGWFSEQAKLLVPIVQKALDNKILVASICNATIFLGQNGFLNNVKHTSNTLEYLQDKAGNNYTNKNNYVAQQAVCDNNIITANGTAYLEFCKEIQMKLGAKSKEDIENEYLLNKLGLYKI